MELALKGHHLLPLWLDLTLYLLGLMILSMLLKKLLMQKLWMMTLTKIIKVHTQYYYNWIINVCRRYAWKREIIFTIWNMFNSSRHGHGPTAYFRQLFFLFIQSSEKKLNIFKLFSCWCALVCIGLHNNSIKMMTIKQNNNNLTDNWKISIHPKLEQA